tara:strand:- start:4685 stop:5119 length:435 start_codon:yes stop_codon:yes gene_type:complete
MNSDIVKNNYLFIKLPNEIIEYIWSFNYLWAVKIIRKYYLIIIKYKIHEVINLMDYARWDSRLAHGSYCINYKNQILKNNDIVKLFNLCNCCIRHKINRPSKYKRSTTIEYNGFRFHKNHCCECKCRHLSRFICRYIPIEERYP